MDLIPLFLVIPLSAAFLIPVVSRLYRSAGDVLANLSAAVLLLLSFMLLSRLYHAGFVPLVYRCGGWAPSLGICMVVDGLSVLMLITVNLVTLMSALFSVEYMKRYTDGWKYYTLFMLMLTGMNALIISGDIFNLYVFLEISALASYALVAFGCEHEDLEASFRYMVLGSVAAFLILLGIGILYAHASTLNMADIARVLGGSGKSEVVTFVTILFIAGFGLKAAFIPFHSWLPDAHPSAPAPISAMLSGVLIKVLGIYALVRIMFNVIGV
jgi:multicomponent Na+:H+ antiporter subunit D